VGKTADIGAQIEMSDMRGDSVLWMDKEVREQEVVHVNSGVLSGVGHWGTD
jgi:hypothetical protein